MNVRARLFHSLASLTLALLLGVFCALALDAPHPDALLSGSALAQAGGQFSPEPYAPSAALASPDDGNAGPWVEPDVLRQLAAGDGGPLRVIVVLHVPGEDPIGRLVRDHGVDPVSARARYIQEKQRASTQALASLEPLLREAEKRGTLVDRRDLWLVDAIGLAAEPALIRDLAASPAVAEIHLDHYAAYITPPPLEPAGTITSGEHSAGPANVDAAVEVSAVPTQPWGVARIRAPEVWANLGITGTGAVVAIIDTGVDWLHPDLMEEYRGNLGKGRFDHSASWYDAVNGGVYPYDDYGHGSHVAGIAVGASTGVAPGATWIGVKVLNTDGYGYDSWILSGLQWLLAPGGDPALAPDIVNGSWGNTNGYTTVLLTAIDALKAAGIFPIFAAGNAGPTIRIREFAREATSASSPWARPTRTTRSRRSLHAALLPGGR